MSSAPVDRHLDWPDCRNARDLGGLPTTDGRVIRTGALIRSDCLQFLTPEGVDVVRKAGVSRVVDLRSEAEVTGFPTPFTADPIGMHVPVQDAADPGDQTTIVGTCIAMLDQRPEYFAAAVRAIAEAPEGAVVVHCYGGKDRTGMVVALALAAAGVPENEIVADYALTQARLAPMLAEQLAAEPDETLHPEMIEFRDTRPASLTAILRHLDTKYGGPLPYLHHGGLTKTQLETLRARLTA
ncbi:tyrosine-protein phosphatase [Kribbella sp. VKM Ac-2568]|uniref:tyrosine-protein phosphatase n=1 Tax=Kribbella sp. VKM Ac-2568 TaxID=2512219 RepID=UPI0010E6775C|nr:tyrosine-protein phosphatase [Kribbella sp. VKM Ac-2568]TCM37859.1 protein tyrosine/serine phosphatase [Kribbella sp. VKM Ac-2568]